MFIEFRKIQSKEVNIKIFFGYACQLHRIPINKKLQLLWGFVFNHIDQFRLHQFIPKICNDMPLSYGFYITMIQPSEQSNYLWFFSGHIEILGEEGS